MNNNELKEFINSIKELIKNKIDNDAKQGDDLYKMCLGHHVKNDCNNVHRHEVISFISRINKNYSAFIKIYAKANNLTVTNSMAPIDCKSIGAYADMLNNLKRLKDAYEKGEDMEKILGGTNE